MPNKRLISRLIAATTVGIFMLSLIYSQRADAHGSLAGPPSRIYNCFTEGATMPTSLACQWVLQTSGTQQFYDWHEVNLLADGQHRDLILDGQLCSAGRDKYAGLDLARDDWPTTIIEDGTTSLDFDYWAWAPHSTDYMEFYLTKDGYDPLEPLKWSDLDDEPFCTITDPVLSDDQFYHMNCAIPEKSGPHVIYNIWQRDDSPEAFYTCSDVFFTDANNPPPVVDVPVPGQCNAHPWFSAMVYLSGDFIVHNGKEWRAQWWTSGDVPGQAGVWVEVTTCDGVVDPPTPEPTPQPTATAPVPTPVPTIAPTPTPVPNGDALLLLPNVTAETGDAVSVQFDSESLDALSAATIHIDFDSSVMLPTTCAADPSVAFDLAECHLLDNDGRVSISLVSAGGVSGDHVLADLTFAVIGANMATSELQLSAEIFTGTNGQPLPVSTNNGSLTVSNLGMGDVNCDQASNVVDSLFILQYSVDTRQADDQCPPASNALYFPACDVDDNGSCDVIDGLFVLQCSIGINNALCPAAEALNRAPASRFVDDASLQLDIVNQGALLVAGLSAEIPTSSASAATTLNLSYDSSLVSVTSCELAAGLTGVCNADYQNNMLALSFIAPDELAGPVSLAQVTFSAIAGGSGDFQLAAAIHSDSDGVALPITSAEQTEQIALTPTAIQFDGATGNVTTTLQLSLLLSLLIGTSIIFVYRNRSRVE